MKKNFSKKIIIFVLIVGLLTPSLFLITGKNAEAQGGTTSGGGSGTTLGGGYGAIAGAGIDFGPIISTFLSCSGVGDAILGFFGSVLNKKTTEQIEKAAEEKMSATAADDLANQEELQLGDTGLDIAMSVSTADLGVKMGVSSSKKAQTKEQRKIEKQAKKLQQKETCFDAIGSTLAKMALKRITAATLQWINSGFEGSPLYIDEPEKFFKDIFQQEVRGLANIIDNPDLNPFGPAVAKALFASLIVPIHRKLERNARFTLREFVYNNDYEAWYANFHLGGWSAWLAMSQIPANNPMGFRFLVSEERGRRTRGLDYNLGRRLEREIETSGFLSIKRCIEATVELERRNMEADLENEEPFYEYNDVSELPATNPELCEKYEVLTPGQAVADSLTISLESDTAWMTVVDEFNEGIAAILDALLNQLVIQVMQIPAGQDGGGLTYMEFDAEGRVTGSVDVLATSVTSGELGDFLSPPAAKEIDLPFEIQRVIQIQQDFKNALNGNIPIINSVINTIQQLDYCVPGPRPGWEQDAALRTKEIFDEARTKISSNTLLEIIDLITFFGESPSEKAEAAINDLEIALKDTLKQYIDLINAIYTEGNLTIGADPFDRLREAMVEIKRLGEFQLLLSKHNQKITLINIEIRKLENLQNFVDPNQAQAQINSLESDINNFQSQINGFQSQIDDLDPVSDASQINSLNSQISGLESQIDILKTQIDALGNGFLPPFDDISNAKREINNIEEQINELREQRNVLLFDDIPNEDQATAISNLEASLAVLEGDLATEETNIEILNQDQGYQDILKRFLGIIPKLVSEEAVSDVLNRGISYMEDQENIADLLENDLDDGCRDSTFADPALYRRSTSDVPHPGAVGTPDNTFLPVPPSDNEIDKSDWALETQIAVEAVPAISSADFEDWEDLMGIY